jgi:hypothetical protein
VVQTPDDAAVRFRSAAFSLDSPTDPRTGRLYDLPLGDDLAAHIRRSLLDARPDLLIDEPIREDWGAVLWVRDGPTEYYINFHWLGYQGPEDSWGIQFSRPSGCLTALLGKNKSADSSQPIRLLVKAALARYPERFREIEWLSQQEYDARL